MNGRRVLVITPCSGLKCDLVLIPPGARVVEPSYYLQNEELRGRLLDLRQAVFADPRAQAGERVTYAFDLYVRGGKAYSDIRRSNYADIKEMLMRSREVEWFFLSGGFGIVHAFEKAHKYEATFDRNIAYKKGIPYTARLWGETLVRICDCILSEFDPEWVYVFGSRSYTCFIKHTRYYEKSERIRVFESAGQSGVMWISPRLHELVNAIASGQVGRFNDRYRQKCISQKP